MINEEKIKNDLSFLYRNREYVELEKFVLNQLSKREIKLPSEEEIKKFIQDDRDHIEPDFVETEFIMHGINFVLDYIKKENQ